MTKSRLTIAAAVASISLLVTPIVFADSFSASVQNLSPGNSVMAKSKVTFLITANGFLAQIYQISDSFNSSSVANSNIDGGGNFMWVPLVSDVGTHNFTITARNFDGTSAATQLTITVLPPPSVSIQSVSKNSISAGEKFTFKVSQSGFTNPSYIVGDVFSGSSVENQNLDSSGNFSWTPDLSQNGKHTITIYATDSLGHGAQASVDVQVGAGATLLMQPITPGTTINAGTTVSFNVAAINFIPTNFSLNDSFAGSTLTNASINSSGNFVWTPSGSDVGTHILTIKGQVGVLGDNASLTQPLVVIPAGASTTTPPVQAPTTSNSTSTLLSSLQAQLAALTTKIENSGSSATAVALDGYIFTSYLKPGMRSDEVLQLQKVLAGLGLLTATPNGYYGLGTTAAVKEFQKERGLETLGVVGPQTRAALNSSGNVPAPSAIVTSGASAGTFKFEHFLGYGDDDSPDVTQLQIALQSLGYLSASAPLGFYGSATENAVKKFQLAHDLPGAGYVDKATRAALNQ